MNPAQIEVLTNSAGQLHEALQTLQFGLWWSKSDGETKNRIRKSLSKSKRGALQSDAQFENGEDPVKCVVNFAHLYRFDRFKPIGNRSSSSALPKRRSICSYY